MDGDGLALQKRKQEIQDYDELLDKSWDNLILAQCINEIFILWI